MVLAGCDPAASASPFTGQFDGRLTLKFFEACDGTCDGPITKSPFLTITECNGQLSISQNTDGYFCDFSAIVEAGDANTANVEKKTCPEAAAPGMTITGGKLSISGDSLNVDVDGNGDRLGRIKLVGTITRAK